MNNFLRSLSLSIILIVSSAYILHAQNLKDMFNDAVKDTKNLGNSKNKSGGSINNLSQADITNGLKQALQEGSKNATKRLGATDGYFGNALIKILMPPEARKVENTLREVGLGSQVDKAILSMNRAAEDAAPKALSIFMDAITHMSIEDGVNILRGGNGAATEYLKKKTTASLTAAFRPVIEKSLDKVNATAYWKKVFTLYNELPTTFNKVNPDLPSYVTERALSGLFINIADEENKIRQDPAARVSSILQKVFGAK